MLEPVPAVPPVRRAAASQLLDVGRRLQRRAVLAVRELLERGLVDVEVGGDLHLRLARAERRREHRVELGLELARVAGLGGLLGARRPTPPAPVSPGGHSSWPEPSVIVTL